MPLLVSQMQAGLQPYYPALLCVLGASVLALLISVAFWRRIRGIGAQSSERNGTDPPADPS